MRQGMRRLLRGLAAVGIAAGLTSGVPAFRAHDAQAADIQFWITADGDGWDCSGCCFTGYCCTVPVDACTPSQT